MDIVVYISLPPDDKNIERWRAIMKRLRDMVDNTTVTFISLGRLRNREPSSGLDDLTNGISELAKANFIIFGEGWQIDKHCQVEHTVAVLYGMTHCGEDEIETFFSNYITNSFKIGMNS